MAKTDKLIRDQLGSIAEEGKPIAFDKAASWQKLNNRLQPQQKKVVFKPVYRWVAAAVLLIAATIALLNRPQEASTAKAKPTSKRQHTLIVTNQQEAALPVLKTTSIAIHKTQLTPEHTILRETELPAITIEIAKEPHEVNADTKPAMKVIHINDLWKIEKIEKELKEARYAFWNYKANAVNTDINTEDDFELPEQFRDDHTLNN